MEKVRVEGIRMIEVEIRDGAVRQVFGRLVVIVLGHEGMVPHDLRDARHDCRLARAGPPAIPTILTLFSISSHHSASLRPCRRAVPCAHAGLPDRVREENLGPRPAHAFTDLLRFQGSVVLRLLGIGWARGVPRPCPGHRIRGRQEVEERRASSDEPERGPAGPQAFRNARQEAHAPDGRNEHERETVPASLSRMTGVLWTPPRQILGEGDWLWRVTWFQSQAYGVSFSGSTAPADGASPSTKAPTASSTDGSAAWLYRAGPTKPPSGFCPAAKALRSFAGKARDGAAWIAEPAALFEVEVALGGDESRRPRTSWWGPRTSCGRHPGTMRRGIPRRARSFPGWTAPALLPSITLPSGGDCGYPGMAWYHGLLWVSYYSSHEGKASIYLAKVRQA